MERILFLTNLDGGTARAIAKFIVNFGYEVVVERTVTTWDEGRAGQDFDLVIVCQQMPLDYLATCTLIRRSSSVPILVLRGRSDTLDMVAALEMGADDFVALPTQVEGLMARIRALIRRNFRLKSELKWGRIIG